MKQRKRTALWLLFCLLAALILISGFALLQFRSLMAITVENNLGSGTTYSYHFAMVADDTDDPFWSSVYESASRAAQADGAYLELVGENLSDNYALSQQMQMAIAQQVDGVLVSPDGSEEMGTLIQSAADAGIPVITMMEDVPDSPRQAHVGGNHYDLGQEYAKLIHQLYEEQDSEIRTVTILLDSNRASSQEILYSSILEQCEGDPFTIQAITVDNSNSFSAEEDIRNLIISQEDAPDVLVCMNYVDTISAYQAVVDYNRVGLVRIIGNYDAPHILTAIQKGIVHSTITVDAENLGQQSIDALMEYLEYGRTSTYSTVDLIVITADTVDAYLQQKEEAAP